MRGREAFELVPIKQVDVYSAVRHQLLALIENGSFAPGDRLPSERQLSDSLQVSRVAVREAMKALESMGRVDIRRGSGTFVTHPEPDPLASLLSSGRAAIPELIDELVQARAAIEVKIVELAAERATAADLAALQDVLRRNLAEHLHDPEEGSLNLLFEAALARAAGNGLLAKIQRGIHAMWVDTWGQLGLTPGDKHVLHREHVEILDAVTHRDPDRAVAAMRNHVDRLVVTDSMRSSALGSTDAC